MLRQFLVRLLVRLVAEPQPLVQHTILAGRLAVGPRRRQLARARRGTRRPLRGHFELLLEPLVLLLQRHVVHGRLRVLLPLPGRRLAPCCLLVLRNLQRGDLLPHRIERRHERLDVMQGRLAEVQPLVLCCHQEHLPGHPVDCLDIGGPPRVVPLG